MKPAPLEPGKIDNLPAGKGPLVWILLRAFCLLMLLTQGAAVGYFFTGMISPELLEKNITHDPERAGAARFFCLFFVLVFGLPLLVMPLALICPRSRLGWYLGAVSLWGGIFTTCGWPLAIPLVVFWYHPEVAAYSGFRAAPRVK